MTTSAITLEPATIVFKDYGKTVQTFKVKVSPSLTGTFPMSFTKVEGAQEFYNDIPIQNVTIIPTTKSYAVEISELDVKSVGKAIEIGIGLEMETPKQFTITYSHNCSTDYQLSPPSYLQLPAGTLNTSISIQYTGSKIPKMCLIRFAISSLTANNYVISNPILYVTGSKSIDKSSLKAPMRLKISSTPALSSDVGAIILTEQT